MSRRRAGADRCLTRLDGEAREPQDDVALLAHGTGWMSPYQRDRYFDYACSTVREIRPGRRSGALR
jgi:hypothetical protein